MDVGSFAEHLADHIVSDAAIDARIGLGYALEDVVAVRAAGPETGAIDLPLVRDRSRACG